MSREDAEEFSELFPIVLKRVLPLGITALIITFFFIVIFVPNSEKVSVLVIAIFGIPIFFGIYAKRYAEKLLNEQKFEGR